MPEQRSAPRCSSPGCRRRLHSILSLPLIRSHFTRWQAQRDTGEAGAGCADSESRWKELLLLAAHRPQPPRHSYRNEQP